VRTAAVGVVVLLILSGLIAGLLLSAGCSEQARPERVCDYAFGDSPVWWLIALGPAALFAGCMLVPVLRRHGGWIALFVALVALAVWVPLLDAVGN
jgi:hypothetical protein